MARVFENPTRICEVLTCKSKWTRGSFHNNRRKTISDAVKVVPALRYHSHCVIGAIKCTIPIPADKMEYVFFRKDWQEQGLLCLQRFHRENEVLQIINKLASQGKFPLRRYNNIVHFNDHVTTQWKHIQLLLRHFPKDI